MNILRQLALFLSLLIGSLLGAFVGLMVLNRIVLADPTLTDTEIFVRTVIFAVVVLIPAYFITKPLRRRK